ncbi:hypothetical protein E4U19_003254 [Claviceps sp. Clav32 group G5]|nr:hypothetical protein E4U19_003254 [Claviceps sp. Clav32 group G5]KAG6050207.1 hypothetical protein E4U39_004612 [Claviceps sp. Clav50 group G5]
MPRKTNWASAKTPPTRQRQQRQTTHLGELDTTPTRPDASPGLLTSRTPQNGVYEQSIRLNTDSDAFEDGLEDGDLVDLVDTQAVPNATVAKEFPWSETGSGARRSSSVSSGGASKSPFGYLGADKVFSSPASGSDALPDTVPLPLGLLNGPLLEDQRQGHMIVDFSETATTMIRSSPVTESHLSKSLGTSSHRGFADRVWRDDNICETPPQPAFAQSNKNLQVDEPMQTPKEKLGNASAPLELSNARGVDVDDLRLAAHERNSRRLATPFMSLDGAADRLDNNDGAVTKKARVSNDGKKQKRKRKQRPKSPLHFDKDTQVVKDVCKKPVRKRTCQKSARRKPKPSSSPLRNIIQREVSETPPRDISVDVAERLATTGYQSSPVAMKAVMHEVAAETISNHPLDTIEPSIRIAPADMPFRPQEQNIMDISENMETESYVESPTSSGVNTRLSESNSPRTPLTISTEVQDSGAKNPECITEKPTPHGNSTRSLHTGNGENDKNITQKQTTTVKSHSLVQQRIIPAPTELAYVDAFRRLDDQIAEKSSASKVAELAAARPSRNISVSGGGSPIRISQYETQASQPISAGLLVPEAWSGTGYAGHVKRPAISAIHELSRSSGKEQQKIDAAGSFEIEPRVAVSTSGLKDHPGLRRSILSELKREQFGRQTGNGQTKTRYSPPADQGRQRLHELVDACMQHLDSKKDCILKIADIYTKAGSHCVQKIQSRFERERSTVTQLATENMAVFAKATLHGKKSVEKNSAETGRLMKLLKDVVSSRALSYGHASSALVKLQDAVLTGENACPNPSS